MIDLSTVTLFTVIGNQKPTFNNNYSVVNRIINASCSKIKFGKIKVLCAQKDAKFDQDVEVEFFDGFDMRQYSVFMLNNLNDHVDTSHVLTFQTDGFILNPQAWTDDFLKYDWVGAPWPNATNSKVGNGGFSLRSKKLLEFSSKLKYLDDIGVNVNSKCTPEDHLICRSYYHKAIKEEIKFAPIELAKKFSYEVPIDNDSSFHPLSSFGFHGVFQKGLEKDPFRILVKKLFFDVL